MDQVVEWILCMSVACIVGGLVRVLAPNGTVQTALHTAIGVFLISCFFLPLLHFKKVDLSGSFTPEAAYEYDDALTATVADQISFAVQKSICQTVQQKTSEYGVTPLALRVDLENTEQEMVLKEISLTLSEQDQDKAEQIHEALEAMFGTTITILNTTNGEG